MDLLEGFPLGIQIGVPVGVFLLICILVPIAMIYIQIQKMRQGMLLSRLDEQATAAIYDRFRADADWAFSKGFEQFEGMYTFQAGAVATLGVWRHTEHPTYFVLFLAGAKKVPILITEFSPHLDLTTGATMDLQACPQAPGHYVQTFSRLSPDEMLERHLAAARYITTTGGARVEPVPWGFEEAFTKGEMAQGEYIRTLRAWPLRAPYWFYVRKRLCHNKSVEQLHRSGKILLPNDRK